MTPFAPDPSAPAPTAGGPRIAEVLPALVRGAFRFLSAGVVPVAVFYLAFRMYGPITGIVAGMVVSVAVLAVQAYRRRRFDPIVALSMVIILIQGGLATATGSVELYLAAPAVEAIIWGCVLLGSVILKRPLIPLIARELDVVPVRFAQSANLRQSLEVLTVAWGIAAFVKAGLRLWLLTFLPVEPFLIAVTVGITGINAVMIGLSVGLTLTRYRQDQARRRPDDPPFEENEATPRQTATGTAVVSVPADHR